MLKKIVALVGLVAATIAFAVFATPAQAAGPTVRVCNSSLSYDNITLYHSAAGIFVSVNQGECREITDANGGARVDVDPSDGESDIDSWHKSSGSGYGPCYNNEDGSSNPYSGAYPNNYTAYKTYPWTGC